MELGLPCIGEPPYYLAQRRPQRRGAGGRKGGEKEERSGLHRRNLTTPTPEGGEKSQNEKIMKNLEKINEKLENREFWRSYAKTDVAIQFYAKN